MPPGAADGHRQASPPTTRVVQVVQLLSAHPAQPLRLTQVSQALGLNRATCLALLTELTRADWLSRDERTKRYTLGRALTGIGRAAEVANAPIRFARDALRLLADEPGVGGARLIARRGDDLVVTDVAGTVDPDDRSPVGSRIALIPPVGLGFMAWSAPHEVEAWFAGSEVPLTSDDRAWFDQLLVQTRRRGYVVTRLDNTTHQMDRLLAQVATEPGSRPPLDALLQIRRHLLRDAHVLDSSTGERLTVGGVTVPIFGPDGRPTLIMVGRPSTPEIRLADVTALGRRMVHLARQITLETGGTLPESFPG